MKELAIFGYNCHKAFILTGKIKYNKILNHPFLVPLLYLLVVFIIYPFGNFITNDGFSYALSTFSINATGNYAPHRWHAVTFIIQAYWSNLFTQLYAPTFDVLRWSVIVCSLINIFLFQQILKQWKNLQIGWHSFYLLFTPLSLQLSMSYMTEAPFLTGTLAIILSLIKYLKHKNNKYLTLLLLSLILTCLIRQSAIIYGLSIAIGFLFIDKQHRTYSSLFFLIPFGAIKLVETQFIDPVSSPNYNSQIGQLFTKLSKLNFTTIRLFTYQFNSALLMLSLLLAPVSLSLAHTIKKKDILNVINIPILILILLNCFKWFVSGNYFIGAGTSFYEYGLGPIIIDQFISYQPSRVLSWFDIYTANALHVIAIFSFGTLYITLSRTIKNYLKDPFTIILVLSILGFVIPSCFIYWNDRYIVIPFCLVLLLVLYQLNNSFKMDWKSKLIILSVGILSIAMNYDYFSFHKTKATLLNGILREQIDTKTIDGGFEFNAYHNYDFNHYLKSGEQWWWIYPEMQWQISAQPKPGFSIYSEKEIRQIIPGNPLQRLYLLRKN